jgi:hypothetical protein
MDDAGPRESDGAADEVVRRFASDLAELRELHGSPSFARMHDAIRHNPNAAGSKNTFHRMVSSPDRIYEAEFVRGFVLALGLSVDDTARWERRRMNAVRELQARRKNLMMSTDEGGSASVGPEGDGPIRWRRFEWIIPTVAIALVVVGVSLSIHFRADHTEAPLVSARSGDTLQSPRDGADPNDSGCARDPGVLQLDATEVDLHGSPVGLDQLIYSPKCGVAWPRFEPFSGAKIPVGAVVHVDIFSPGEPDRRMSYEAKYAGAPVFGNVLRSTESCVYAAVTIDEAGRALPASRTHCFRGKTAVR